MPNLQSPRREITAFKNGQKIAKALKMTVAVGHGARKGAVNGATGIDQESDLLSHKSRQAAIPEELMDIVGSAEALK